MKTTIEIAGPVLEDARRLARKEGVTLRVLVEEGLRTVVAARGARKRFRLKDAGFAGKGVQPGMDEGSTRTAKTRSGTRRRPCSGARDPGPESDPDRSPHHHITTSPDLEISRSPDLHTRPSTIYLLTARGTEARVAAVVSIADDGATERRLTNLSGGKVG